MAIGWHFFHEGDLKYRSAGKGGSGFSAEGYLRNATGPFAPQFRALIPDPFGLDRLDEARLTAVWRSQLEGIIDHYHFDANQEAEARKSLEAAEAKARDWFRDGERVHKLRLYHEGVERLAQLEHAPPGVTFERERAEEARKKLDADRREFLATVDAWSGALRDSWVKSARPEQVKSAGDMPAARTSLDRVNLQTTYGLMIIGACLMLGLFTPLAALGAAGFLAMIYLSMPPWPGLPEGATVEGHYLIVNKNLIEMLACLVIASTPSGLWLGLDALLFGWIGRGRRSEPSDPAGPDDTAEHPVIAPRTDRDRPQGATRR